MNVSRRLEQLAGYSAFRPVGTLNLDQAIVLLFETVSDARQQGIRRLLVDYSALTGIAVPSIGDRYRIGEEVARAAIGLVKVALVVQEHLIDPKRFGVIVARNRGTDSAVFTSESEAVEWLLATDNPDAA